MMPCCRSGECGLWACTMAARWSAHHRQFRPCASTGNLRRSCSAGPPCDGTGCQEIPAGFWVAQCDVPAAVAPMVPAAPVSAPVAAAYDSVPRSSGGLALPAPVALAWNCAPEARKFFSEISFFRGLISQNFARN